MIGLLVFGALVLAGLVTLIVIKVLWSIKAKRNWQIITARNEVLK